MHSHGEVYVNSNLDLGIQNSIPTENRQLLLVTAKNENNKERTNHKTSHKYPANPVPQGGHFYTISRVFLAALETYNVIRSAASCIATAPHLNHFSAG